MSTPSELHSSHADTQGLMVITESESPVVVVLSGSMEPAFHRGDILFLHMGFTPFRAGDIVVFKVADREIPIVHRVIKVEREETRSPPSPPPRTLPNHGTSIPTLNTHQAPNNHRTTTQQPPPIYPYHHPVPAPHPPRPPDPPF